MGALGPPPALAGKRCCQADATGSRPFARDAGSPSFQIKFHVVSFLVKSPSCEMLQKFVDTIPKKDHPLTILSTVKRESKMQLKSNH